MINLILFQRKINQVTTYDMHVNHYLMKLRKEVRIYFSVVHKCGISSICERVPSLMSLRDYVGNHWGIVPEVIPPALYLYERNK